ncbi:hypothetical protein H257_07008 [Aphanomyces astaci]|uniref:Uncharacterized protein n=1 Tax=Aphanomyces astaci TaxID=112090 RepID=W4GKA7_APHAT|nr:hypothetical protein H257_07008 [Aphanomyces astaci]ETV79786.1 hypothetical protein H257_07008 [Aphanomyces astaci]|eukprot:XP_009830722.1 hypothetical protein H257_07008 [Aphanomyces astaci]
MGFMEVTSAFVQLSKPSASVQPSARRLVGMWLQSAIVFGVVAGVPVMETVEFGTSDGVGALLPQ